MEIHQPSSIRCIFNRFSLIIYDFFHFNLQHLGAALQYNVPQRADWLNSWLQWSREYCKASEYKTRKIEEVSALFPATATSGIKIMIIKENNDNFSRYWHFLLTTGFSFLLPHFVVTSVGCEVLIRFFRF